MRAAGASCQIERIGNKDVDAAPPPLTSAGRSSPGVGSWCSGIRSPPGEAGDWVKLTNRRGQLIAVGVVAEKIGSGAVGVVQPRIVFS